MIEQELIEEIRQASDISAIVSQYVSLKRSGSSLVGLCPFHNEKTPSFHVMRDRQSFHCFGCGVGGNVITFVMMIENYDFLTAVKLLAEKANIVIEYTGGVDRAKAAQEKKEKKKILFDIHKIAARFFYERLRSDMGEGCLNYLKRRGLSRKTQVRCGLGHAPAGGFTGGETLYAHLRALGFKDGVLLDSGLVTRSKSGSGLYDRFFDRLMFPIFDVSGNVCGFGGRTLSDSMPKYLNSPETDIFQKGRLLYGLNFARKARKAGSGERGEMIIVEGYMDAISLYQAGFSNTVASLGTAFTKEQARLLKNYADSVILLYDSDDAGVKAVYRAIPELVNAGLQVKVAQTDGAKDPDEYVKKHGPDGLLRLLSEAKSHIAFRIDRERERFDLNNIDGRVSFTKEAAKILAGVASGVERDAYIKETARLSGISEEAVRAETASGGDGGGLTSIIRRRRLTVGAQKEAKGLSEAQKGFLGFIANNSAAFYKARGYIDETVFTNDTYKNLYRQICGIYAEGGTVRAEELASRPCFDKAEKQSEVYAIISAYEKQSVTPETEKAFSHQIKTILSHAYERKIAEYAGNNDEKGMQSALNQQKTLKDLNISLADG